MSDFAPAARAYAYHVPSDPQDGSELLRDSEGGALIRTEPLQVGDRIGLSVHEIIPGSDRSRPEHVISGSEHEWLVVAIEAGDDDGQRVAVRGWRKESVPIWAGVLVLRRVE